MLKCYYLLQVREVEKVPKKMIPNMMLPEETVKLGMEEEALVTMMAREEEALAMEMAKVEEVLRMMMAREEEALVAMTTMEEEDWVMMMMAMEKVASAMMMAKEEVASAMMMAKEEEALGKMTSKVEEVLEMMTAMEAMEMTLHLDPRIATRMDLAREASLVMVTLMTITNMATKMMARSRDLEDLAVETMPMMS